MTRERIADGLDLIVMVLANAGFIRDPAGWTPEEWTYVKGLASGELLRLRDRIVPRGTIAVSDSEQSRT